MASGWGKNKPTGFSGKMAAKAQEHQQYLARKASQSVIFRSPVDTGQYRGAHKFTNGAPDYSESSELDKSGSIATAKANDAIAQIKLGTSFFIANSLPYAARIENNWSDQAPKGVYRLAFLGIIGK